MDLEKVFDKYVDAVGLTVRADFRKGVNVYVPEFGEELTREQVMGTHKFAGFVDGLCNNIPKYNGAKGGRNESKKGLKQIDQVRDLARKTGVDMAHLDEFLGKMDPRVVQESYMEGYILGQSRIAGK